jgi:hypothetical protein
MKTTTKTKMIISILASLALFLVLAACGGELSEFEASEFGEIGEKQEALKRRVGANGATISALESIGFNCDHGGVGDVTCKKCGTDSDGTKWCITYTCDRYTGDCYYADVEEYSLLPPLQIAPLKTAPLSAAQ